MGELQETLSAIEAMSKAFSDEDVNEHHETMTKAIKKTFMGDKDVPTMVHTLVAGTKKQEFIEKTLPLLAESKEEKQDNARAIGAKVSENGKILMATLASSAWVLKVKDEEVAKKYQEEGGLTENGKPKEGVGEMVIVATRCIDGRTLMSQFEIKRKDGNIVDLELKSYMPATEFRKASKHAQLNLLDQVYVGAHEKTYQEMKKKEGFEEAMENISENLDKLM